LREEVRLKVFENRVLERVFGPKRNKVTGNGDNYIMTILVLLTKYFLGYQIEKKKVGGKGSTFVGEQRCM